MLGEQHGRRNRGVWGDIAPPTFEAKRVQGGTMKTIYSSQFRLYIGVRINTVSYTHLTLPTILRV